MLEIVASVDHVAKHSGSPILVIGETGTGKELIARRVHQTSVNSEGSFVPVNCGALPEQLVESELFGHVKGSFTGAVCDKRGLFEDADRGTLFLDEIGELPVSAQVKLLRFLENGEIRRVGDNRTRKVNPRLVCATNQNLENMIENRLFREDLYYRISTFKIEIPPLRERRRDLADLIDYYVKKYKACDVEIAEDTMTLLLGHKWKGNVRELNNVLEHAAVMSNGVITPGNLPKHMMIAQSGETPWALRGTLREITYRAVEEAVMRNNGDKPAAAAELGVALKTIYNTLNRG